jgi:hypothetical protein
MNIVLKKKISILIHLARVDNDFANIEKSFIEEICTRNGVSSYEFEQLVKNPDPIGSLGALSYKQVVEYMSESLSLMIIDNKIRKSEILLCEDIGLRLGFQKKSIDEIIEKLKDNTGLSMNSIIRIVESWPNPAKA